MRQRREYRFAPENQCPAGRGDVDDMALGHRAAVDAVRRCSRVRGGACEPEAQSPVAQIGASLGILEQPEQLAHKRIEVVVGRDPHRVDARPLAGSERAGRLKAIVLRHGGLRRQIGDRVADHLTHECPQLGAVYRHVALLASASCAAAAAWRTSASVPAR